MKDKRKLVIYLEKLTPKLITQLHKILEKQKAKCYMEDEKGNILPFLKSDFKKIYGAEK